MKILFVYRFCGLGGVETSILNRLKALQKQGVEAHALFSEFYGSNGRLIADHSQVTVTNEKSHIQEILSRGYDIITVIDYPEFMEVLEELDQKAKVIFETHASFPGSLNHFYSQLNHPRVWIIVVPSQFNQRMIHRLAPTAKSVVVLPNAIDTDLFYPRSLQEVQSGFPQLSGSKIILWIGRIENEKNPIEFIKIAQDLLELKQDFHFVIVGDSSDRPDYKQMLYYSIRPQWRKFFTFYEGMPHSKMPELYSLAAETGGCLVSTSLHESAPMTFIEAMACKCPVVSSNVGGVKELISDRGNGLLYQPGRIDEGVDAIMQLSHSDTSVRSRIVETARNKVSINHSLEKTGKFYVSLLNAISKEVEEPGWLSAGSQESGIQHEVSEPGVHKPQSQKRESSERIVRGLVSTIIPVYNRPALVSEAIASVLSQTYRDIEVIVVDDGSTDETADLCDRIAEQNPVVRVIHISHLGRPGLVREVGRLVAKGEYIQYLDSDDLLAPEKFEKLVAALENNPQCDIAYCFTRRYQRGEKPSQTPTELTGESYPTMLPAFLGRRFWHTSTPLYRRSICDQAGPWSDLPFWEDIEHDIRIATMTPQLYHCKEFLTDYRDHALGHLSRLGFYNDPVRLAEAARAAGIIYKHVQRYGIGIEDEHLAFFLDDVSVIHRRCKELQIHKAAEVCAGILLDAKRIHHQDDISEFQVGAIIAPQATVLAGRPGEPMFCPVRIVNKSNVTFRPGEFAHELSYHLLSADGTMLQFENPRTLFEKPLRPGEERIVNLFVRAPQAVGLYYMEIDILWGPIGWLKSMGNPAPIIKFIVGEHPPEQKWWLQVNQGNDAKMLFPAGLPERIRVAISRTETTNPWDIQLNYLRFYVIQQHRYSVNFKARSDRSRTIGVAVSKSDTAWDNLGLYQNIDLNENWQSFQLEFLATEDNQHARIHFDVGGNPSSVEISFLRFIHLTAGTTFELRPQAFLTRLQMDIGIEPLSYLWGTDRGLAVHRYYLEQFLQEHIQDIRGHCLEFQDPQYTPFYGGNAVSKLDILHIDASNPAATLHADLTKQNSLPSDEFDCIICTHVLHVIFDVRKAVSELYRILKPGGVFLVAVPQTSMCGSEYHELWRFTGEGLKMLLAESFQPKNILIRQYGNSLTAAAELRGFVSEDFTRTELDTHDPRFSIEVCARALK